MYVSSDTDNNAAAPPQPPRGPSEQPERKSQERAFRRSTNGCQQACTGVQAHDLHDCRDARKRPDSIACHHGYRRDRFFCASCFHVGILLLQEGQSSFTYILDGKAIFAHHDVTWRRGTETIYAQHVTAIADVAMPALRYARFDGKSRMD
jgi:hypothetical protein